MKTFRLVSSRALVRTEPERIPSRLGEIVMLNNGSPWGLLLDINGDECTVGLKRDGVVTEYIVPCSALHQVLRS